MVLGHGTSISTYLLVMQQCPKQYGGRLEENNTRIMVAEEGLDF
jgi:hypothetical protein